MEPRMTKFFSYFNNFLALLEISFKWLSAFPNNKKKYIVFNWYKDNIYSWKFFSNLTFGT